MDKPRPISNQDMFRALDETAKEYGDYIEIQELYDVMETSLLEDYSMRDMSHPLGIVWGGRGNGALE